MKINLHGFKPKSKANGPGTRAVIWFQGCTLNCGGCGNTTTHGDDGQLVDVQEVKDLILEAVNMHDVEGVTFSGGEPLQQPEALRELMLYADGLGLSVIVSTGYTPEEIAEMPIIVQLSLAVLADVVITGRYMRSQHLGSGFRGSANKEYEFNSDRYTLSDFANIEPFEVEIVDGTIEVTGVGVNVDELVKMLQ